VWLEDTVRGGAISGFSPSRYSIEVAVASRPIRTNPEEIASVERGRRECR
jgi:hypothetical protein